MTTSVLKNHGAWSKYTPIEYPEGLPPNIIFCRGSSMQDWYEYQKEDPSPFTAGTVYLLLRMSDGAWTVAIATRDYTKLFPVGGLLMEVSDPTTDDPQAKYAGHVFSGGAIKSPDEIAPTKASLLSYALSVRYAKETGGFMFNGHRIASDDRSKGLMLGCMQAATRDPTWTTIWQGDDGEYNINAAAIGAMFDAQTAHVNSCFLTFSSVKASINSGDFTTKAQVDGAFANVG